MSYVMKDSQSIWLFFDNAYSYKIMAKKERMKWRSINKEI
jgi:hypothetical protein